MKNGMRTWIVGIGAFIVAVTSTGCGSTPIQTAAKAGPTAYPVPDVQIVAQPMLASYDLKAVSQSSSTYSDGIDHAYATHAARHKHWRHKKHKVDAATGADPDMGFMAADDPKLLQAEIASKETHKEDWKQWAAPSDKAPDGR